VTAPSTTARVSGGLLEGVASADGRVRAFKGDPNGPHAEPWPRLEAEAPVAMHFGDEVRCGPVPRSEQLAFWDAYYARRRSVSRSTQGRPDD
jgi:hypothetical protein